ncbi:hypothetical protein STEG23_034048 [Scotinomys teguina]
MSMESGTPDPDPSSPPLSLPRDEQITFERSTSGSQPNDTEGKSSVSENHSREHTDASAQMTENTRKRKHSAQMTENTRKRKRSSKDSQQVQMGKENTSHSKKRQKTSAKKTEPEANGHRRRLGCRPDPKHTGPPPLRESLVVFLRTMSEAIYGDMVQLQTQQQSSLLTQEQLSKLTQLSRSLSAMVQTFHTLANQAAFAFPAEGWLVPAPMSDLRELSGNDSQSSSLEEGQITESASPSDKS